MALIPTRETFHEVDGYLDADIFNEGVLTTTIREGWYKDPSLKSDQLIEREQVTKNQFDNVVQKTVEEWEYDVPGGAPRKYKRQVWSKAFVPEVNPGRTLKLMEEETKVFWTFTGWAKDALAYRREVNGWCVYDLKPTATLTADAITTGTAQGREMGGASDEEKRYVIASGRLWSEAIQRGSIVEKADVNQTARWVTGVIVEETDVSEEPDRWTVWTYRKFALRPDHLEVEGPVYYPKESYRYRLHVPVAPPTVNAQSAGEEGVRVDVRGGGALINIPLQTGSKRYDRHPDKYRIFRRTVDETTPTSGDPHKMWINEPPPRPRRTIIEHTFVGGYDGVKDPGEGLPTQTNYTEPGDADPIEDDGWRSIGDVDNQADDPDRDEGIATLYDGSVKPGGTYAYAAVAVVQSSESALSSEALVTYEGDGTTRSSIVTIREAEDGSLEGDLEMPDDPGLSPDPEVGEMIEYEIPAAITHGPWASSPAADRAQLTVAATPTVETYTFSITPKVIPEAWAYGRRIRIVDPIGPQRIDSSGNMQEWVIDGKIQSTTDTQVTVHHLNADGHTFPVGAFVEPLAEDFDQRVTEEDEGDLETIVLAIGQRQGLRRREESFSITVQVGVPLLGLAAGQRVVMTGVNWDAWGNALWLQSRIEEADWILKGYEIQVERTPDGAFKCEGTKLTLEQR